MGRKNYTPLATQTFLKLFQNSYNTWTGPLTKCETPSRWMSTQNYRTVSLLDTRSLVLIQLKLPLSLYVMMLWILRSTHFLIAFISLSSSCSTVTLLTSVCANGIWNWHWVQCFNVRAYMEMLHVQRSGSVQFMLYLAVVMCICWGTLFTWKIRLSAITDQLCCLSWPFFNKLSVYNPPWGSNPFSTGPASDPPWFNGSQRLQFSYACKSSSKPEYKHLTLVTAQWPEMMQLLHARPAGWVHNLFLFWDGVLLVQVQCYLDLLWAVFVHLPHAFCCRLIVIRVLVPLDCTGKPQSTLLWPCVTPTFPPQTCLFEGCSKRLICEQINTIGSQLLRNPSSWHGAVSDNYPLWSFSRALNHAHS